MSHRDRLQRRMAMSRQMLQHRLPVTPAPEASAVTRPLTDVEHEELLTHDVTRIREASLLERAIQHLDERIRHERANVETKRQDLQAAWQRLTALEHERAKILAEQLAARRASLDP